MLKLSSHSWRNLALVLDGIPQKDLPNTAAVRKCIGAVKQIHKAIEKANEEYEKIDSQLTKIRTPIQEKINKIKADKGLTEEQANFDPELLKVAQQGNKLMEPLNKKYTALDKKYSEDEIDIEFNEEYKNFVKEIWEEMIRPMFHNERASKASREIMVKIADSFGI